MTLRADTGAERWRIMLRSEAASRDALQVAVAGDQLYVSGFRSVYALDPKSGAQRWAADVGGHIFRFPPVLASDRLYVAHANEDRNAPDGFVSAL